MKAHEIIKELKLLAPDGIHNLLPISEAIEELRDYVHESKNKARAWQLIDLVDQLHNCTVTLAHFVPCDANGVPLENKGECSCAGNTQHCHGCNSMHYHCDAFKDSEAYNEAQKSVIFEGWEVVRFDGEYLYIVNKESDIELEFNIQDGVVEVNLNQSTLCNLYGNVTTYADLAEATTENPLKLK